jgi:hypothetical protein
VISESAAGISGSAPPTAHLVSSARSGVTPVTHLARMERAHRGPVTGGRIVERALPCSSRLDGADNAATPTKESGRRSTVNTARGLVRTCQTALLGVVRRVDRWSAPKDSDVNGRGASGLVIVCFSKRLTSDRNLHRDGSGAIGNFDWIGGETDAYK